MRSLRVADLGALDTTQWIHEQTVKDGIKMNMYVGTVLVDVEIARKVFDDMEERNVSRGLR